MACWAKKRFAPIRTHLMETARAIPEAIIEEITDVKVSTMHGDNSRQDHLVSAEPSGARSLHLAPRVLLPWKEPWHRKNVT
jgi:hypothetical protein